MLNYKLLLNAARKRWNAILKTVLTIWDLRSWQWWKGGLWPSGWCSLVDGFQLCRGNYRLHLPHKVKICSFGHPDMVDPSKHYADSGPGSSQPTESFPFPKVNTTLFALSAQILMTYEREKRVLVLSTFPCDRIWHLPLNCTNLVANAT
jgi:hypothetical protein